MRRFIHFIFVCLPVLAACSPKFFQREQVARTFIQEQSSDSVSMKHMVDLSVQKEMRRWLDSREVLDLVSVREVFSQPDSIGQQYVKERTTTGVTRHTEMSAKSSSNKVEQLQELKDSTHKNDTGTTLFKEESSTVIGKQESWMPWYVYIVALVGAFVLGAILGMRWNKWRSCKS